MSFYDFVRSKEAWERFIEKEEARDYPDKALIRRVKGILKANAHAGFTERYLADFELPKRLLLSKYNTSKKRTVYVYPGNYRLILKLAAFYILQNYNNKFCRNSIAYIEGRSVKSAFNLLAEYKIKETDVVYKSDFSDYFNSIDIDLLDEKLKVFLNDDYELYELIMRLLREPRVLIKDKPRIIEQKGVMAGSPIAGILANVFMHDVDEAMLKAKHRYIRYADDTLIVGEEAFKFFNEKIAELNVMLNPKKTKILNINTGITFLGFHHIGKTVDISPDALEKMKSRLIRRARWYRQWMLNNNVNKKVAIRDYIKKINRKLYSDSEDTINWSRWYLPNINTIDSIKYLDLYYVACIRYLNSGTWTRGKHFYSMSYDDMKALGYRSLVNEYYKLKR